MKLLALVAVVAVLAATSVASAAASASFHPREFLTHSNPLVRKIAASKLQAGSQGVPPTVASLNISAYTGRWFNVYADLFVLATFQNNSFCATATYSDPRQVNGLNTVNVLNWERYRGDNASSSVKTVYGYAQQGNPQMPGRLGVCLITSGSATCDPTKLNFLAPYWILDPIGPIVGGQYQWAIVTDEFRLTLFVLARDLKAFEARYEKTVMEVLQRQGFTGLDAPIKIEQGPQCAYPSQ
jgi:apolipoprotein D and lipocalin family protein